MGKLEFLIITKTIRLQTLAKIQLPQKFLPFMKKEFSKLILFNVCKGIINHSQQLQCQSRKTLYVYHRLHAINFG